MADKTKCDKVERFFNIVVRALKYSGLFLLMLLTVLVIYKIVIGTNLINDLRGMSYIILPVAPVTPEEILSQTQNIISFVALVIALVSTTVGLIFWHVRKKIEKFEQTIEKFEQIEERFSRINHTMNSTLLIAMEIAIWGLPKFDESQHIPLKCAEIACKIDEIFNNRSELEQEMDKTRNGAKLRLVRSLHYFAIGDYPKCIGYLTEIVDNNLGDMDVRRNACYWLGIAYRQRGDYELSAKYFSEMEK